METLKLIKLSDDSPKKEDYYFVILFNSKKHCAWYSFKDGFVMEDSDVYAWYDESELLDVDLIKNRINELVHRREHPSVKTLPPSDRNDVVSFLNGEIEGLGWVMDKIAANYKETSPFEIAKWADAYSRGFWEDVRGVPNVELKTIKDAINSTSIAFIAGYNAAKSQK